MTPAWLREGLHGALVQWQVVHAVILRETRTRFGSKQLGYLWALLEPVMMIGTFAGASAIVGRRVALGTDTLSYYATGFLPYLFFRAVTSRTAAAVSGNRALLFYPQVFTLDLIIARTLLEVATYFGVAVVLLGGISIWNQHLSLDNMLYILCGLGLASALGSGLGLVLCAGATLAPIVEKLAGFVLRPLMWISGIFFTANELPSNVKGLLLYNPLLHCTEWMRDGWYPEYTARDASFVFPASVAAALILVGLAMERVARNHLGSS